MPPSRVRPPRSGDERTQLVGWLDLQRAIVHLKCDGLSDEGAHRVVLPSSPLMTVAGLVSHLRWVEHYWFEVIMRGGPTEDNPMYLEEPEDAEMRAEGVPLAKLLDDYDRQCRTSNTITAEHGLDDLSVRPRGDEGPVGLRWILLHMIEETARHAGHLDILRETLDGRKDYY